MRRKFDFIRSVVLLICMLFIANSSYALNQLTNSHFTTDASGWTPAQNLTTIIPEPRNIDRDIGFQDWSAVNGGCFYTEYVSDGNNHDANAIISQSFSTPADTVNVRLRFDHRDYEDPNVESWFLGAWIRDADDAANYPNEAIINEFHYELDTSPNHTGAWDIMTLDITLAASSNFIYRVHWHFGGDNGEGGGAYVDNLRVDFSPTGLTGGINGTSNELSWNVSTTPASDVALRGTNPYKIYWGTTSGSYTGSSLVTTNSFSHIPPAGSVVYYAVTDFDGGDVESPYSVEWPIVRQTVNDGAGADVDTIIGSDISMNWAHIPVVTGFVRTGYQVALGSTPGGSDVAGWVDLAAGDTSYTFTGVSLTGGNTYYTSVRMVTDRGTLNYSSSDGFVSINLDVRDGSGADLDITSSLTDADLNWGPAPFAVGRYDVALGTTPGGTDIVGWTNVNLATSHSFGSLSLNNGGSYYCSVKAFDPSLAEIAVFSSDGFTPIVNTTLTVRDGSVAGSDIDYTFSQNSIDINWDDATGLAVLRYEAALGTTPGATNIVGWTDMGVVTSGNLSGFTLTDGQTYYASVRIVHAVAGELPAYSSDGFTYYKLEVRDGTGADQEYSLLPDTIQGNWDAFSGSFLRYEVAVGTTMGGSDIVGWTNMGTSTSASFSGLALVSGTLYHVSVRVIDMGGTPLDVVSSNGCITTIVADIVVRDGLFQDIESSFLESQAEMNWDHTGAGVIRYEAALGTSKYGSEIHPFTDVGQDNQIALSGLSLASGTRYYSTVRGINSFGVIEAFGSSDGFVARRDPVLVDTASQSYFNNARVLSMIDTTADPDSITPKVFSGGGAGYWRYSMPVVVTEPGVTDRINAPCHVTFSIPVAQRPVSVNEFRVADEYGNDVPCVNLNIAPLVSTVDTPHLVFLVNMGLGETKTYRIFWGNTGAAAPAYGFVSSTNQISNLAYTAYYSRKLLLPGIETVPLAYNYGWRENPPTSTTTDPGFYGPESWAEEFEYKGQGYNTAWRDDARSNLIDIFGGVGGDFYFYGTNDRQWRVWVNGLLYGRRSGVETVNNADWQYCGWAAGEFHTASRFRSGIICPFWADLRYYVPGYPSNPGVFRDTLPGPPAREVFTWRCNNWLPSGAEDDIYIFQTVLYITGDIAHRYSNLSPRSTIGGSTSNPVVNLHNTAGLSANDSSNYRYLQNTPLNIGIGKTPTSFFQCMDAFRNNYVADVASITGGAAGTWVDLGHIESMVFDSRTASPIWQKIEYDFSAAANNRLLISTRSGATPLPDSSWSVWSADVVAAVAPNNFTNLSNTDRYIQYRCRFQRNNNSATLPVLEEVRFVHGGISIEEVIADTPEGVAQGQTGISVTVTIKNFYTSPVDLTSLGLTFTLGSYTHILVEPAVPGTQIPAGSTITATFTVDVAIDSPTGTATVDAFASATSGIYTFEDEDAQTPHEWLVRSRANLSIIKVETIPTFVNKGQADILVNMLIANLGETPYYFQGASLTFSLGDYEPQTGSLTTPLPIAADSVEIAPLSEFTAIFTVKVSATSDSGFVALISGTASGTDKFSGLNTDDVTADITDSWTIQNPASLVLEEVIASATVYRGQTNTPVFLRVSNMGEATAIWEYSDLLVPPYFATGTYDACYSITPFSITLPGYMETTARYGVDISPTTATCTDSVNANIYGSDENSGGSLKWDTGALLPATWTIRAEKLNTFKDPAYAFPSASFNRPTVGNITVYARGENVNPYAEYVFRWIDPDNNTVLVSSPLTADASGTMYHQFDITPASLYGNYKVRITNPTNTIIAVENIFEVTSPAILSGMFELPAQVSVGQPFVGSMTFVNTGGAKIESGYASPLDLNTALLASLDAGPDPAVIDVEGDGQATATYDFTALAPGNFSASATVYGFDANDGSFLTSAAFLSNNCLIQTPPSLTTVSVTTTPTVVYLNQKNLRVDVVIENNGQATAVLEAASLTFAVGQYTQTILSPAFPYELVGGGANITITYDIAVNSDSPASPPDDTFFSNVLWHDKNWPSSGGYLTGSPPSDAWTIQPRGIHLSASDLFDPMQQDFNQGQTVYIRGYGLPPGSTPPAANGWYRILVYDPPPIPQTPNAPGGAFNQSPPLSPNADGFVEHEFALDVAATIGTWSVVVSGPDNLATIYDTMQSLQYFRVQQPGNLVASLTISPAEVFVGEEFTVTMLASNTIANGSTISNASPALLVPSAASAGSATLISGPTPASATVAAGKASQYIWTYQADSNTGLVGSYSLTVDPAYYAAGYDLNTSELVTSNKAVSNRLLIYSRDLALASATLDFGVMECGDSKMVGPTQIQNLGNYPLDFVKWITTDLNGPGMIKISKANLGMSPLLIGGIAAGAVRNATATLFIPYNKEAGDYIATMSVYQDLNGNNLFDLGELYDFFAVKVTVPPCKRVFAAQDIVDLGDWGIGKTTLAKPVNIFSGGNLPLDNVKMMVLPGATNTFDIDVIPDVWGGMGITESFIASVSATNVANEGFYIATWTVWDDWHNVGTVDADEASDTFQVHIRVGTIDYSLVPALVDAGTIEPSEVKTGFGLTLNNLGSLPLTKLKFDPQPLINATFDVIGSESIAVDGPLPTSIAIGGNAAIGLVIFAPAGMATGTYTALQYFYYDDDLDGKWDVDEYRNSFTLQVEVLLVAKVQVLSPTVGLGGISPGTSKIVGFNCRNTGNVDLTGLRWTKSNLVFGANPPIPAANASFPPSELFSVPAGQFFTRQIMLTVPAGAAHGVYNSVPGHFWLYADMPVNNVIDPTDAQSNFMVSCEVGDLKVDIDEAMLNSSGGPNVLSSSVIFNVRNIGSLNLASLKATATVLVPTAPGPIDIPATSNVINSANIGALNISQFKQSTWRVSVPPNASAATYVGTLIVWEDANGNGINESAEASTTVPLELTVTSTRAIDVTTSLLDLQYVGRNSSKSGNFEIRNVGNLPLSNLLSIKAPLVFGAFSIPVGNVTLLLPANNLAVGASMVATATVTIGPVQGSYTYNGTQAIFEDHLAPLGSYTAGEASDTFVLRVTVGDKGLYVTNPANPPLDFGARNVNANYSQAVTVYNSNPVPLPNVRWQILSPLTGSTYTFPVASLSFNPPGEQSIAATPANYSWNANLSIGPLVPPGNYIATAVFYDDEIDNNVVDNAEASATFNVLLSVNATHSLMIVDSVLHTELNIVDFGQIDQGAAKELDVTFKNTGNVTLSNYSWVFSAINHSTEPTQIDAAQLAYDLAAPVAPGDYGTIKVTLTIPPGQTVGNYGPTAGQTLFASTPAAASDGCEFQCEVTPSGSSFFAMQPGSAYQTVATSTFSQPAPGNHFFLSAWVCPGSGSADLSLIQYDEDGQSVATAGIRVNSDGTLAVFETAPVLEVNHHGVAYSLPIDIDGEPFRYYRIYMSFELEYNPAVASHVAIVLQNSSVDSPRSVWFDGIQLEKAFAGQTRPTAFGDIFKIHSPNRNRALDGRLQYYEW